MKIEAWPGGRWYRDLGNNDGHLWGHVQSIKRPTLLEITGPLFMSYPAVSNVQYRLSESDGGTLIKFRHAALGLIQDEHRKNVSKGWGSLQERIRAAGGREPRMTDHKVVSQAEWLAARKDLLAKEKEFTRQRDAISAERRKLPWVKVEEELRLRYAGRKEDAGRSVRRQEPVDRVSLHVRPGMGRGLPELFFPGRSFRWQHRPPGASRRDADWRYRERPCRRSKLSRNAWAGASRGYRPMEATSISTITCRLPKDEMAAARCTTTTRRWSFPARKRRAPACFTRTKTGDIFHTYSTYGRGLDILLGAYNFLDLTPKGRDEEGLKHTMAWVRHHDKYVDGEFVDLAKPTRSRRA